MKVHDYKVGSIVRMDITDMGVHDWIIISHSNGWIRALHTQNENRSLTMRSRDFNRHVSKVIVY